MLNQLAPNHHQVAILPREDMQPPTWSTAQGEPERDESAHQQAVRTRPGTWQFMSAYTMDNQEPVRIADELEAFFNLSLYMALRYTRHNCNNLPQTMSNYFERFGYDSVKGRCVCGLHKDSSMRWGQLLDSGKKRYRFLDVDRKPSGNHPLDEIFDAMLPLFRARYQFIYWCRDGQRSGHDEPNAESESLLKQLDTHTTLIQLLDSKLGLGNPQAGQKATPPWPQRDKVGDQLRPEPPKEKGHLRGALPKEKRRGKADVGKRRVKRVKRDHKLTRDA